MPSLDPSEIERYARHILLPEVGGAGQARLKASRVLVVGAGGLGAPLLLYLAAAGVGRLGVIDDDVVELSNLQRQVIHGTQDLGRPKPDSAARTIADLNPHVAVDALSVRLDQDNVERLVANYDLIADGSDNFATRRLLANACEAVRRPLVTAALGRFDGSLTTLIPYESQPDGSRNPRLIDLFPDEPPPGAVPSCAEAGVLGAVAGVMGALQASEVLKVLLDIGTPLVGALLLVDVLHFRFETFSYGRL